MAFYIILAEENRYKKQQRLNKDVFLHIYTALKFSAASEILQETKNPNVSPTLKRGFGLSSFGRSGGT